MYLEHRFAVEYGMIVVLSDPGSFPGGAGLE